MLSYGQQRERSGRGNAGVNMLQMLLMDNKGIGVRGYTGQPPHMPVALCGLRGCRLHEKAKVHTTERMEKRLLLMLFTPLGT
jgi:hypothetical protein